MWATTAPSAIRFLTVGRSSGRLRSTLFTRSIKRTERPSTNSGNRGPNPVSIRCFPTSVAVPAGMPAAKPKDASIFDCAPSLLHLGNWRQTLACTKIKKPMDSESTAPIRAQVSRRCDQSRAWLARLPAQARIILGFFLVAAVLMALHTASTGKDASLHLTLQHGFRSADLSLWIVGDLGSSGDLVGSTKKKFGLIPGSVYGRLSEIVPVSAGTHQIRVRVRAGDGSTQQDRLTGGFSRKRGAQ